MSNEIRTIQQVAAAFSATLSKATGADVKVTCTGNGKWGVETTTGVANLQKAVDFLTTHNIFRLIEIEAFEDDADFGTWAYARMADIK